MAEFSHLDDQGKTRMVDVGAKQPTERTARAQSVVLLQKETVALIREHKVAKGNVLETARLAGIMAAKRAHELIPLCHPINLTHVDVDAQLGNDRITLTSVARVQAPTGVEMEALVAASVAALTVYDMCKAVDRSAVITDTLLLEKKGGKSGHYTRDSELA